MPFRNGGYTTMNTFWGGQEAFTAARLPAQKLNHDILVASHLAAAAEGDSAACFDLGVAFSTGSLGMECDLVEAHKWFNLAALGGRDEAAICRADVAEEMTAREIAEAQRRARQWLSATTRKAA